MTKLATLACLLALAAPAWAEPPFVELSAQASRVAPNDLLRASVYAEAQDTVPATLARRVNQQIAAALDVAKTYANVKVQSGGSHTYPVYGKNGRSIDAWRMRSELRLESRDTKMLSELLGKLQATLAVGSLETLPAPETRQASEDAALVDAIHAFEARARLIGQTLGRQYRIKQMSVQTTGMPPVVPMPRAKVMAMAEAAPMPVEAGESEVTVNVTGQIELLD